MSDPTAGLRDVEDVTAYPLDPPVREELLRTQCSFVWSTRDGWPVGVT